MVRKTELKSNLSHFSSYNIVSCFIFTDLIRRLLDTKLVDPIYVDAYDPNGLF